MYVKRWGQRAKTIPGRSRGNLSRATVDCWLPGKTSQARVSLLLLEHGLFTFNLEQPMATCSALHYTFNVLNSNRPHELLTTVGILKQGLSGMFPTSQQLRNTAYVFQHPVRTSVIASLTGMQNSVLNPVPD